MTYMWGVLEKVVAILMWLTGQLHWPSIVTFLLSQLFVAALAALSLVSLVLAVDSMKVGPVTNVVFLMT